MRFIALLLVVSPAVAAGSFDWSLSAGASWPHSDICDYDSTCPVAPQFAVRIGYSPSLFGESAPLSLGVRGELNAGPGSDRSRDPSNNSRALLLEALAHTAGRWQLTGSIAAGIGSIVSQHGQRDDEVGAVHGDALFVAEASLGARVVLGRLQLGVEGRFTDWPAAVHDYDDYVGFSPPHRESTVSLSAAAVLGVAF